MGAPNADDNWLYAGLREIAESGFPKHCKTCGRVYQNAAEYVEKTGRVGNGGSGLKQSIGDDGEPIVELFRNCVCGSTLMDAFGDRRNLTPAGLQRRERFTSLLQKAISHGLEPALAQRELLKLMRGEPSNLLKVKPRDPPLNPPAG
jgi:hypothetical protein